MMPNPWMILGAIFVCISAYIYGHHAGFVQRDQEMQAEIAVKNDQAREAEQKLNQQLIQTSIQLQESNNVVNEKQSALDRAIRSGRVRLPSAGCVQASPSASPAPANSQAGSESDTETLRLIAQIAADGDRAINQLNACVDAYNQVREQINGQR
jgi:hypothetical protein